MTCQRCMQQRGKFLAIAFTYLTERTTEEIVNYLNDNAGGDGMFYAEGETVMMKSSVPPFASIPVYKRG